MPERPYARYTRTKTWHALYAQAIQAGYAIVPNSATNNSIWLRRCTSPEETQTTMSSFLAQSSEIETFFARKPTHSEHDAQDAWTRYTHWLAQRPACLKVAGEAVVLARSSDYWHYHLEEDRPTLALVVAGLHDSYLHLPVWETSSNRRYAARETALPIGSPLFDQARRTQQAHRTLLSALAAGNQAALNYLTTLPDRTQRRLRHDATNLQQQRYRGRPLAFHSDEERRIIGAKISEAMFQSRTFQFRTEKNKK